MPGCETEQPDDPERRHHQQGRDQRGHRPVAQAVQPGDHEQVDRYGRDEQQHGGRGSDVGLVLDDVDQHRQAGADRRDEAKTKPWT